MTSVNSRLNQSRSRLVNEIDSNGLKEGSAVIYCLVPLTVRTTFRAAFFTLLPSPLPLAELELLVVFFPLEVGMRALTGLFVGAFRAAG